jgi:MazG family protein
MSDASLEPLLALVRRLRAPDGCPWDREQTLADVRAYLLEEAHEVAAAIDERDPARIAAELGDLLFQVVFTSELTREGGGSDLAAVAAAVHDKMVARHPHVFGDEVLATSDDVQRAWETGKAGRKAEGASILDGLPRSLPSLVEAYRMTQKAAGVGFDWPDIDGVLDKLAEELEELRVALGTTQAGRGATSPEVVEEVGDLLFAVANLARHLGVDPEGALARTNLKFRRRFGFIEERLASQDRSVETAGLEDLDALWERAKASERDTPGR